MALAAELVLIQVIHLHAGAAFFIFKDRGMAVAAFKHRRMHLMAENRRRHIPGGIAEVFFKSCHVMALGAVLYVKGNPAVMASPAGAAFIHFVHYDIRRSFFHLEELRMAFAAAEFLRMVLVRKCHRQAGGGICKRRKVMAVVTGIFV